MSNPYVGIQHTVFKHGWRRALKEMEDRLNRWQAPFDEEGVVILFSRNEALRIIEEIAGDAD